MAERVLITGARAAAAVDLARDFARAGYEVHMADCAPARIARASRAATAVHAYPSPVRDPKGFRDAVSALAAKLEPVIVVPACEEVFHLAAMDLGGRLFQPAPATLRCLHDKGAFAGLCEAAGLPVPKTHAIASAADLDPFRATLQDWAFKARFSRFGEGTLVSPAPHQLAPVGPGWIAQRRIEGREISFYAVAHAGRLSAFAVYGSGWRMPGGASLTFDPVEAALAQAVFEIAAGLAAATDLTGQFACDLIVDAAGRPWLIECNPRATSGVHLLVGDGRLARAMIGPAETPVMATGEALHLLPAFATYGLGHALRQGRFRQWTAQLAAGRDVAGRPGDRIPAFGAMADGLGFMLAGWRLGVSTTAATTIDIEWNGEDLP